MTITDIHTYVDQELQRMGYFVHDHFHREEIDLHINKIIREFVRIMHGRKEFPSIATLLKVYTELVNTVQTEEEYMKVDFPEDYFLHNSSSSKCFIGATEPLKIIPIMVKDSFEEAALIVNPYAQSNTKKLLAFFFDGGFKIYLSKKIIIKGITVNYTCKPKTLDITLNPLEEPDLPESTHDQLSKLVAEHLKRIIESSRS